MFNTSLPDLSLEPSTEGEGEVFLHVQDQCPQNWQKLGPCQSNGTPVTRTSAEARMPVTFLSGK